MKKANTKFMETTNRDLAMALCFNETFNGDIPLSKFDGKTYCNLIDMLRLLQYEMAETKDNATYDALLRVRNHLIRNELLPPYDDDDVPPYTPEPGCANCPYRDFSEEH